MGNRAFDNPETATPGNRLDRGSRTFAEPALLAAGLPTSLADALDDASLDPEIRKETDEALSLTGRDVGTPIIQFNPPDSITFSARSSVVSPTPGHGAPLGQRGGAHHLQFAGTEAEPSRATTTAKASSWDSRCRRHRGGSCTRGSPAGTS